MAKSNNVYVSSFSSSSVNPIPKPLKCFVRLLENIFLSRTAVFHWHTPSKAGRVSVEDDECLRRASTNKTTGNVDKIQNSIHKDRCQTISELSDIAGIRYGVFQEILTGNSNMRLIAAKFVPRLLRNDQKQLSVSVWLEL
jgi:hypothetical protein